MRGKTENHTLDKERNVKAKAIKLLSLLRHFYSFRELQERFNIPFQVLWKYTNLLSMPEKETAEKILNRARELKLVEKALQKSLAIASKDSSFLISSPSFMKLFSFLALLFLENQRIDVVIPFSEESVPHATLIAYELNAILCPLWREAPLLKGNVIVFYYYDNTRLKLVPFIISRNCTKSGQKVVIVDLYLSNAHKLDALLNIIGKANVVKVIALEISNDVRAMLENRGISYIELVNI